jgi:hypothetical protein
MKNTRRFLIVAAVLLGLAVASVGIAYAITNGEPDAGRHPYVGLLVFDYAPGSPGWRCSGSLIAPNVVLTAGHCTDGAVAARVWFDEEVSAVWDDPPGEYPFGGTTSYEGIPYTNPDYGTGSPGKGLPAFDYRDVGVVVLTESVTCADVGRCAILPAAGLVDEQKNKTGVDLVGYGVQWLPRGGGPPWDRWTGLRARLFAPSQLVSGKFVHSDEFIRLTMNPGGGTGGSCFGDSGGPDLLGGTDMVLAVNSYVTNYQCAGVGYSSRVDIQEVLDWIINEEYLD